MNNNPIDPHLRAALRHAPDGDMVPPTALDQRIKAAARHALLSPHLAGRSRLGWPNWIHWRAWLDHLLAPPAAAALATLALGTVIGVMWQGQVPPEAMPGAPSASADVPAVVGRLEPKTSDSSRPQASDSARPEADLPVSSQAAQTVAAPTAVARPAPPAPRAAEPARRIAENEVAALVSPPLPPTPPVAPATTAGPAAGDAPAAPLASPDSLPGGTAPAGVPAPAIAVAPALATAPAIAAAKRAGEPRAATDAARPFNLVATPAAPSAPQAAPPTLHPSPPVAALAAAAAGPWQPVPSSQMPEGGNLVRDAQGQVLGRMLVEPDWLWWQPWTNEQPGRLALRAPARRAASAP